MLETVLKRFEEPDEIRSVRKRKIRTRSHRGHDHWPRHVPAGMEVVASRRARLGRVALQRRACWAGALRLRHGCDGGWHQFTNSAPARSSTFHPDLPVTIVGWWAMSPTSRCTFLGLTGTQTNSRMLGWIRILQNTRYVRGQRVAFQEVEERPVCAYVSNGPPASR